MTKIFCIIVIKHILFLLEEIAVVLLSYSYEFFVLLLKTSNLFVLNETFNVALFAIFYKYRLKYHTTYSS